MTICAGATMAAIHIAMPNISRACGFCARPARRSRSRCQAPVAPTTKATDK